MDRQPDTTTVMDDDANAAGIDTAETAPDDADEFEQDEGPTQQGAPQNLLDRLRGKRQELAEEQATGERFLILPVPGYNNELFLKFVYAPNAWDGLKQIGARAQKSRHVRRELHAAQEQLAYACTEVLVSEDQGETLESLDPSGEPVRLDDRCAELLGFTARKAKEVVAQVFNNDIAITAMSNRVMQWMQGEDEEVDEDFPAS